LRKVEGFAHYKSHRTILSYNNWDLTPFTLWKLMKRVGCQLMLLLAIKMVLPGQFVRLLR